MKKFLVQNKEKILQLVALILFLVIIGRVFLSLTYLFRGYKDTRISVVGIKEEKKDSLDVIYIGDSAVYAYWNPLKAYKDYGFTSYDLSVESMQAESILAFIKYAQKYQNPNLYIIELRPLQVFETKRSEVGLRVSSDVLDMDVTRAELINNYIENGIKDTDKVALYWDIAKYHTNYDVLKNPLVWKLMDNSYKCDNKGYQIRTNWSFLEMPEDFQVDYHTKLLPNAEKILVELLEYLKDNNLNALFVSSPYFITEEHYSMHNTMNDIVSSYGYYFLNANDYYNELNVDFSKDFYDINHMNTLGAEKYTTFLGNYLVENYELLDHRGNSAYEEWEELSESFIDIAKVSKDGILEKISYADANIDSGDMIRTASNFPSWGLLVNDKRYDLVIVGDASGFDDISSQYKTILSRMGLSNIYEKSNYINVISGTSSIACNDDGRTSIVVKLGQTSNMICSIENTTNKRSIIINNEEYSCGISGGVDIVVYDNFNETIIDSVNLSRENSRLILKR